MIAQAITNLHGGYSNRGGQDLIVEDRVERLPTADEQVLIDAEVARLEAEATATAYKKSRAEAYASIGDQLDMQYHDAVNGTTTWKDHITAVKTAHPKGD